MDKFLLRQQVLERLAEDLLKVEEAVRVAHEAATHEENIAENKYDTLGLEAAYPLMARSNSPTLGHPKFPQAGPPDYDDSGATAMRAAASLRR